MMSQGGSLAGRGETFQGQTEAFKPEETRTAKTCLTKRKGEGVVAIQFTEADRRTLSEFQALVESGEKGPRALALTGKVIAINSASYPAWVYRWHCLREMSNPEDLMPEQYFLEIVAADNVKNYQLWNHRRQLAFQLGLESCRKELEFAGHCLEEDPKNYHTWAHRQAVVEHYRLWSEELIYTAVMISDDMRNNSAWNQRFQIIKQTERPAAGQIFQREINFTTEVIRAAPDNESPWNYLRGIVKLAGKQNFLARCQQLHQLCQDTLESRSCTPALSFLADIYLSQAKLSFQMGEIGSAKGIAKLAAQCFESLQLCDPIRRHYWTLQLRIMKMDCIKQQCVPENYVSL